MEAKLIKKVDSHNGNEIYYSLIIKEKCIGTTHNLFNKEMKENNGDVFLNKLSLKNCDSLFGVVDVEKLAEKLSPNSSWKHGFIKGFNKAMELNNKVFTLEDVILIAEYVRVASQSTPNERAKNLVDEYLSTQPIEIEVEIESKIALDGHTILGYELDSEGQLILKKI